MHGILDELRLEMKYAPIEDFIMYATNPRKHPESQIDRLVAGIKEFGFVIPVLTKSKDDMTLVAGHGRLIAAKRLGLTQLPYIPADHMTPAQVRAFRIFDNRVQALGEDDFELLESEFDRLIDDDFDLDFTGFDEIERKHVSNMASRNRSIHGQEDEDDTGPIPVNPITRMGDMWYIGPHRLVCATADDLVRVVVHLGNIRPILIVTSPPYNQKLNKFKPSGMLAESGANKFIKRMSSAYKDDMPEDRYQQWQRDILAKLRTVIEPHGSIFYNHKIRYRDKRIVHPLEWLSDSGWRIRQEIIWSRPGSVTQNARMFIPSDERIYWMTADDAFIFNDDTEVKTWSSVWKMAPKLDTRVSAPFPVELPRRAIIACSNVGDVVMDPFAGVGTTLIAADQMDRRFIGTEIAPAYVDTCIGRAEKLRGLVATLGKDGPTFQEVAQQRVGDEFFHDENPGKNPGETKETDESTVY